MLVSAWSIPFSALAGGGKAAPIVWWTTVGIESGNELATDGDKVNITSYATDPDSSIESFHMLIVSPSGESRIWISPVYNGESGCYEKQIDITDDTEAGYWKIARIVVTDPDKNCWDMYPGDTGYTYGVAGTIKDEDVLLEKDSYTYTGKSVVPQISVYHKGKRLKEGTDYTLSCNDNVNAGEATATVKGIGCFKGEFTRKFTILPKSAFSVKLSKTVYTYSGKMKSPGVTVYDGGYILPRASYKLTYNKNRANVGTYSVKVEPYGNYTGSRTVYYTINPVSTSIKKLTPRSKGFTASWKKKTAQTTGYQVRYSTSKSFTGKATVTLNIKSNKTNSKTIKRLKSKKRYYVQTRTYKTVNGRKYYSSWSKTKSVVTK